MLKRVFSLAETRQFQVPVGQADPSALFPHSPEFNPPAHGVWNIVHVGMLVPESHQVYVCGVNCMRGVVLTAAEMNRSDRFSMVLLEEEDLIEGTLEDVTAQGVIHVLERLERLPPVVMVFTVCTHRFLGCDLDYIYRQLEARFPTVRFLRCFMEPVSQKEGLSPDQRLRRTMYDPLEPLPVQAKTAVLLGSDFALDAGADLRGLLAAGGWTLREIQDCQDYEDFLSLGSGELFFSVFPRAQYGVEATARRLGRRHLHLPASFSFQEIRAAETALARALELPLPDFQAQEVACRQALAQARAVIGDTRVVIDFTAHPRPLGLARLLLEAGFWVETVYLNAVDGPELADFRWLQENAPGLLLSATIQPQVRVLPRGAESPALAVGQIAAWREDTAHFINLVEGGGLWGYDGVRRIADLLIDAFQTERDTRDLVPRKGLGCESCL